MRKKVSVVEQLLDVTTRGEFEEFLVAHHDAYVAVRFGASQKPQCSHRAAVKRLDRLIEVWKATTALSFPYAKMGLHHRRAFRAAQAYVADLASLMEEREYEQLGQELDSAVREREVEFKRRPGGDGWVETVRYPIGLLHGDAIVTQCLLELSREVKKYTPSISLGMNRDEVARWMRSMRQSVGLSPWRPPPTPVPGPRDPAKLQKALALLREGRTPKAVRRAVGVSLATVYRWRKEHGLSKPT